MYETLTKWLQVRNFEVPDEILLQSLSSDEDDETPTDVDSIGQSSDKEEDGNEGQGQDQDQDQDQDENQNPNQDQDEDKDKNEDEDEDEHEHEHGHFLENMLFVDMVLYTLAPNGQAVRSAESIYAFAEDYRKEQMVKEYEFQRQAFEAVGEEFTEERADDIRKMNEGCNAAYDLDMRSMGWYEKHSKVSGKFLVKLEGIKDEIRSDDNWLPYRTQLRKVLNDIKTKIDEVVILDPGSYYRGESSRATLEEWFYDMSMAFITEEIGEY